MLRSRWISKRLNLKLMMIGFLVCNLHLERRDSGEREGVVVKGDLDMGYNRICHLDYDGVSGTCPIPRL